MGNFEEKTRSAPGVEGEAPEPQTGQGKGVGYSVMAFRYGLGIMFSTMMTAMISTFWAVYLTGTAGLDTVLMASVLSITALVDTVSLPFLGAIMQKIRLFHGKYGMFRPWLVMGAVLCGLFFWMRFTDLGMTGLGQAVWFGVACFGYNLCFNLAYTAYNGVLPLLAPNPDNRIAYSATRNLLNSAGQFVFSLVAVSAVALFGQGNDVMGYSLFAVSIAALYVIAYTQLAAACKKADAINEAEEADKQGQEKKTDQYDASLWQMIRYTLCKPFVLFICAGMCRTAMYMIVNGLSAFYYTYVAGDASMLTVYLSSSTGLMILGSFIAPFVAKYIKGSRNLYALGVGIFTSCLLCAFLLGSNPVVLTALMCVGYVGWAFAHSCEIAYYSSVVDYSSLRAGRDLKPFMMMLFSLIPKLAITIGSTVLGFGLVAIGFDATAVTAEAASGLKFLFSGLPAAFGIACVVLTLFNPMNKKLSDQVARELAESEATKAA